MEQTSFTYVRELEVNGGLNADQTLIRLGPDAGNRVRSVHLIKEKSSGCDQMLSEK